MAKCDKLVSKMQICLWFGLQTICPRNLRNEWITRILNKEGCISQTTNLFKISTFLLHLVHLLSSTNCFLRLKFQAKLEIMHQSMLSSRVRGLGIPRGFDWVFLSRGWGLVKDFMQHKIQREEGTLARSRKSPKPSPAILKTLPRAPWDCCAILEVASCAHVFIDCSLLKLKENKKKFNLCWTKQLYKALAFERSVSL